jgi:hypothetical protein
MMRPESEYRAEDAMADPATLHTLEFLAWVARGERTYGEVRQAWRSTCPRLTAWEDALDQGLVAFAREEARTSDATPVLLTSRGRSLLDGAAAE